MVGLSAAGQQGGGDGDADTAADIALQVEKTGGIAHLLFRQVAHGKGSQRHKGTTHPDPGPEGRPTDAPRRDLKIDITEHVHADRKQDESDGDQFAHIDPRCQYPHKGHGQQGTQPPRADRPAGRQCRIAHHDLQVEGLKRHRAVKHDPQQCDQYHAHGKVPVGEYFQVDDRFTGCKFAQNESHCGDDADTRKPPNLCGCQPIELLAFVEHHLQGAQPDGHQPKTDTVDLFRPDIAQVGRVLHHDVDQHDGQHPHRQIDIVGPSPGKVIRQPAA